MSNYTDQSYLRSYQYQDSSNLSARALLHKLYSTNPENWQRWIFNQLALPERCKILELGSGPGYLWQENQQRILPGWKIVLSDFSTGMLEESQDALGEESGLFFGTLDAQSIPFPENSFEAIIANHMLYHVPSIERAFAEIQRVLIPGGCLYAATNGLGHLAKIRKWKKEFFQEEITTGWGKPAERLGLENGENQT